jgi:hypothetical protein
MTLIRQERTAARARPRGSHPAGAAGPRRLARRDVHFLLFDADGNRMTPTHAVKKGRRYRYYVSHPLIAQARAGSPGGLRVPAPEIEQLVAQRFLPVPL